jgi:hypothetical protein
MLFNVGKLLMLSGWASKMIDRVSLYGDVEVPPPGAVATLALMRDDMDGARDRRLFDIMVSTRSRQASDPIDNVYGMLNVLALRGQGAGRAGCPRTTRAACPPSWRTRRGC